MINKHEPSRNLLLKEVSTLMSQLNQNHYPNGIMNEQQFNQISQALYSYCTVMREPKVGPLLFVIPVFVGVSVTFLFALLGEGLLLALALGGFITAIFAFLCWFACKYRREASKRLNSYLAVDGGQGMYIDFVSAQPFANDQFRLGRYYLYIRNGAVIRIDSITDIVRVWSRSGVGVNAKVNDENGSMSFLLCILPQFSDRPKIDEIRKAVRQRQMSV